MTQPSPQALAKAEKEMRPALLSSYAGHQVVHRVAAAHTLALAYDKMSEAAGNILLNLPAWFQTKAPATFDAIHDFASPWILPPAEDEFVAAVKKVNAQGVHYPEERFCDAVTTELARRGLEIRKRGE